MLYICFSEALSSIEEIQNLVSVETNQTLLARFLYLVLVHYLWFNRPDVKFVAEKKLLGKYMQEIAKVCPHVSFYRAGKSSSRAQETIEYNSFYCMIFSQIHSSLPSWSPSPRSVRIRVGTASD